MSSDTKHTISALLEASSYFNVSDILVNATSENGKLIELSALNDVSKDVVPVKLIREAEATFRESGINPLCSVDGFVELNIRNKSVRTPLILASVEHHLDKIRNVYSFTIDADSSFVNPFLIRHLSAELNVLIPEELIDSPRFDDWEAFLLGLSLNALKTEFVLGNFHHHRFSVIKELEELLELELSSPLSQLLGEGHQATRPISLSPFQLFPSDTDHVRVFESVQQTNTVIQGPPGTGKSQVLTNLVAKCISENASVLVVSEKFAALEVIQKKLGLFQLDRLSTISTSKKDIKSFLLDLKQSWDYFESLKPENTRFLHTSGHYESNLQMTIDLLSQPDLVGGVSYSTYQKLRAETQLTSEYVSNVPELSTYLEEKENIHALYHEQIDQLVGRCKSTLFLGDHLLQLDERIRFWLEELNNTPNISGELTWNTISETMRLSSQLQIFENDLFQSYHVLLRPGSREQKRYLKLKTTYAKLLIQKSTMNQSHWKISPSLTEVTAFLSGLSTSNYFQRRKLKKRWNQLSEIPFDNCTSALEERREYLSHEAEIAQVLVKFCDLGINDPESQLPLIDQTLPHFTTEHWKSYESVSSDQRTKLTQSHAQLNTIYRDFRSFFQFRTDDLLIPFLTQLQAQLPLLIQRHTILKRWESSVLNVFQFARSFEEYTAVVVHSHSLKFEERFPQLANYHPSELGEKIARVIQAEDDEAVHFAKSLNEAVRSQFQEAHNLLNTPSKQLNSAQKIRKSRLKKGKSLLVKEFSKTRQHPTLRQLFQSEAREWIQLLKPIWLSNPSQLADCFPMEKSLFDVVIFDEASQIPLQNSLGALQRSERAVVAGDEHQMGPASYFVARESEPINLLHQASYHFPKITLEHHYRSVHSDLIAFSNQHFYGNSLQVFPHFKHQNNCLTHHYIPEGVFEDRSNNIEAKEVAKAIEHQLQKNSDLGIVAFSEEQLNCIWNHLSSRAQDALGELISSNRSFFKALENVQGDECDHLIVSFGYGKNTSGEFHHRFGPMNTSNGRKRLNVLLTRARTHIDFFCSIQSDEFKLSENESINLIRQWIRFSENHSSQVATFFPFHLKPTVQGNALHFSEIYSTLNEAKELVTVHRVLTSRGWNCLYL